jgi:O-antigen/teichoic acid export membrane protein
MVNDPARILRGAGWTFGSYVVSFALRFATNVILARLLAPDIFGVLVIVTSIRFGVELTSDFGVNQNIIYSKKGEDPQFYNTAWTMQLMRGVLLFALCLAIAGPVASFYDIPVLTIQISAVAFLFAGASSLSLSLAVKNMELVRRNIFDAVVDFACLVVLVVLATLSPTIWSVIVGGVLGSVIRCVASFWLPSPRHRLLLVRDYALEILSYGKWIFVSSLIFYASSNIDRLYVGKVAPLAVLGIYGIARSISDVPAALAVRLSQFIVFPLISSAQGSRADLRRRLAPMRMMLLLAAATALSLAIATGDVVVAIFYDQRYQDAAWMLSVLLLGVWGAIVCSVNEASLLGVGRPAFAAIANGLRLACLALALPVTFSKLGLAGAIGLIALSDLIRYIPILAGQMSERFTFLVQDMVATFVLVALIALWLWLRIEMGWGTPFDGMPITF